MQPQQPSFGQENRQPSQPAANYMSSSVNAPETNGLAIPPNNDAEDSLSNPLADSLTGLDAPGTVLERPIVQARPRVKNRLLSWKYVIVALLVLALLIAGFLLIFRKTGSQSTADNFSVVHLPLKQFSQTGVGNALSDQTLQVNGNLQIANSLSLTPTIQPATGTAGLLYYDKTLNQFAYFNGQAYVPLGGSSITNVANTSTTNQSTIINNSTTNINGALNAVTSPGGTAGTIAVFTGGQTLGDSLLAQNNGTVEVNGNLDLVNNTPGTPMTIWDGSTTPAAPSFNDPLAVEVGIKFQTDITGKVNGIRFYKGASNTGTHIGNLWTVTGHLLATITFTNETASGWQEAQLSTPVTISPGNTYIVSYHTDVGFYAADVGYFTTKGFDTPPLHALQDGADGDNGVFMHSATTTFPNQGSTNGTNYWVDVDFTPNSIPGTIQFAGAQITSSALSNNADLAKRSTGNVFSSSNTFRNINNSAAAFVIQDASSNVLFTADTGADFIIITHLSVSSDLVLNKHVTTASLAPPVITIGPAACTGGGGLVGGTDVAGLITINTGTGCGSLGKLGTVAFNAAYTAAPRVVLTPANASAAGLAIYVDKTTISASSFDLQAATGTITDNTEYDWYYQIIQ